MKYVLDNLKAIAIILVMLLITVSDSPRISKFFAVPAILIGFYTLRVLYTEKKNETNKTN